MACMVCGVCMLVFGVYGWCVCMLVRVRPCMVYNVCTVGGVCMVYNVCTVGGVCMVYNVCTVGGVCTCGVCGWWCVYGV